MYDDVIARPRDDGEGDELLTVHSDEVATFAPSLGSDDIRDVVSVVGRLHDLGKSTTYFQHHVRGEYVEETTMTYHARLGAFAAFHAVSELDFDDRDRLAGLLAVLRHHGRIPDAADSLVSIATQERREDRDAYLGAQVENVASYPAGRAAADRLLRCASDGSASWTTFVDAVQSDELFESVIDLAGETRGEVGALGLLASPAPESLPDSLYDRTIRVWSALTLADKTCSAGLVTSPRLHPRSVPIAALEDHIEEKRRGLPKPLVLSEDDAHLGVDAADEAGLDQLREAIRRLVRENASAFGEHDRNVATITLPTGLGKTFTGLTAAYTIRDGLSHEELGESHAPRVVYALPYTSIIEQTREVFEDALDADPFGRSFTVHHYLSDTVTYPDIDSEDRDGATDDTEYFDAARFGESWRSGTVLTTFVQLFESLTGPTNARGLKLPALHDAVILLDEPQTLPRRWWAAIRYLVDLLVTEYDATVISMTATQPNILKRGDSDVSSLLSETGQASPPLERAAFDAVSRTTYHVDDSVSIGDDSTTVERVSHETAGSRLVETATDSEGNASVLAVCNTIESTSELASAATSAARASGHRVHHVGDTYGEVLNQNQPPLPDRGSVEPETIDDQPAVRDLAAEVLNSLDFEAVDRRADDITDWTWQYDGPSDRLFVAEFSSRYRPRDRRVLVTVATILAHATQPFVLASTQAVEAGVDISFRAVFRDLAPLDSVVQAGGRCNRSFEWGPSAGDVTVWSLAATADGGDPPANYIYPQRELTQVRQILEELCERRGSWAVADTAVETDAIPAYFDWVAAHGEPDAEDRELTRALETCQGDVLATRSLVDAGYETRDVLVAYTPLERAAVERLTDLLGEHSHERAEGFELLRRLSDLRVSVPVTELTETTTVTRVDGRPLGDPDGVGVLETSAAGPDQFYDLGDGGLRITDVISDRFSF